MARNVELKARLNDLATVRRQVHALGAAGPEDITQVDTFFHVPAGRLKLREFDSGVGELIYYARPDTPGPKVSTYSRTPVTTPDQLRDVLTQSLGVRATVRKQRAVFLLGQTRIHLDRVDGLGSFVELEVVLRDEQSVSDGYTIAMSLLQALSIAEADLIAHAYVDLLEPSGVLPRPLVE